jgi:hypothetical protein
MAKRRCLMILSVLSGRVPVTDAIREAKISRGTYYKLETRALQAMLAALTPGRNEAAPAKQGSTRQLEKLTAKLSKAEADKRRLERLLSLSKRVLGPGPVKSPKKRTRRRASARAGSSVSERSSNHRSLDSSASSGQASTHKPAGEVAC